MWYLVIITVAVGAVIGYFTNWLAIKMLFRPYQEIKFLGHRLPFTPGVIPKERYRLSKSIGEVITTDLLTPEDFKTHFMSEKFSKNIYAFMYNSLEKLLDTPLQKLLKAQTIIASLVSFFGELITQLLKTEGIHNALVQGAIAGFEQLLDKPLKELLTSEQIASFFAYFDNPEKRNALLDRFFGSTVHEKTDTITPFPVVRQFINEEKLINALQEIFREFGPEIQRDFVVYCKKPEIHKQLETLAITIIRNYIQKLNTIQRLIINIGGFDNALYESIPATVDDAIIAIGDIFINSDIHSRIALELAKKILYRDRLPDLQDSGAVRIQYKAIFEALLESFSFSCYGKAWHEWAQDKTVRELLELHESHEDSENGMYAVLSHLASPQSRLLETLVQALKAAVGKFFDSIATKDPDKTIRALLTIQPDAISQLAGTITKFTVAVLVDQIPVMLQLVDIQELVTSKLDALDMAMLENLTIKVMNKELKAITLLGGLLGAVIGLFQALLIQLIK